MKNPNAKGYETEMNATPKDPLSSESSGQPAVRLDERAGLTRTPERPLHEYVVEVSERTKVRRGGSLPLGIRESDVRRC
jgi:hypothetical protein